VQINIKRRRRQPPLRVVKEKRNGRVRFKVAGYYEDGRRKRCYFGTQKEAETFIQAENTKRQNLGNRAQRINGALAEDAIRAADLLRTHGMTVYDAARTAAEAAEKLAPFRISIADAIDSFLATMHQRQASVPLLTLADEFVRNRTAKQKSRAYLYDLEKRLSRFVKDFGAERIVSEVQASEVDAWIHSLRLGPQSINNFRAVLSAAWSFAVKRGYAGENVIAHIDKVKVARDNIGTFSPDEVSRLLNAAAPEVVPFLGIGVFAGLRPEEIKRLRWSDVSLEDRLITVNATVSKTARKRFAEIPDNLAEWQRPFVGRMGSVACPNLQKLVRDARDAAGIKHWPHDVLRHTFASAHYAHFQNPAHTALVLGHRDQQMLMNHYRNLMRPSDAARYWEVRPVRQFGKIITMKAAQLRDSA
jgi:integrase